LRSEIRKENRRHFAWCKMRSGAWKRLCAASDFAFMEGKTGYSRSSVEVNAADRMKTDPFDPVSQTGIDQNEEKIGETCIYGI